jgi:copper chaperone CopZ
MTAGSIVSTYGVTGMNCEHCAKAVTTEVSALPDVRTVEVDVTAGAMTITSDRHLDETSLRDAVAEAGFELAGPARS